MFIRALLMFLALNAAWEMAQLPFYTLWQERSWREIAYAVAHCTLGDGLIGAAAAVVAAAVLQLWGCPSESSSRGFLAAVVLIGVGYAVFSEWLNVHVRSSWAYSDLMPLVPPLGTGLTPLLQWVVVPLLTWQLALRSQFPIRRTREKPSL